MTRFTQLALAVGPTLHATKAGALARRMAPGWQTGGACVESLDPDAWFPARSVPASDLGDLLAVCEGCPVRRSCLAAGLLGHEAGIWGGTTEEQRDGALADLNLAARVDEVLDRLLGSVDTHARGAA